MKHFPTIVLCAFAIGAFAFAQQTSTNQSTSNTQANGQNGRTSATASASSGASSSGRNSGSGSGSSSSLVSNRKPTHAVVWFPGEKWVEGKSTTQQPFFKEHTDYLMVLLKQGKNIMSGPWRDEPGGLTLLRVNNDQEAQQIVENDPMVKNEVLTAQVKGWVVIMDASTVAGIK